MLHTHIKSNRFSARVMPLSAGLLLILSAFTVFPFANDNKNAEAAAPTPSETTLNLSTSDLSLTFNIDSFEGTFSASDPATISVSTNNYTGYTLSLSATSDDENATKLVNGESAINSISSASTPSEFNVNNWGYLPSKFDSNDNTLYRPAPGISGATLERTNSANLEANEYTVALGAKADYSTTPGTYRNTFRFNAVANPTAYSISYNKNTEDEVANLPSMQSSDANNPSVEISSDIPTRTGHTFANWNTSADGSGDTYNPGDTINLNQTTANDVILYARWVVTFDDAFKNKTKLMSNMNPDICNAVTVGQRAQLIDYRDGKNYNVGKLADGRCWMLDNLAIDLTDSGVQSRTVATTTNANLESLEHLLDGNGSASDKYAINSVSNWTGTGSSYSAPLQNLDSVDVIPDNAPSNSYGNNKVGGYYNFCAASAGSYCYGEGSNPGAPSGDATEDICPAGWRMPTGGPSGEYQALATATIGALPSGSDHYEDDVKFDTFRNSLSLPFSGYFFFGAPNSQGGASDFWSSTKYGDDNSSMYRLQVYSNIISPIDHTGRNSGTTIRCIAYTTDRRIVKFNANGGEGTMVNQAFSDLGGVLSKNTFTRPGYTFTGWNTAANGSGTSYANSATYTGTSTTLYAQWQKLYIQNVTTATCPTTASIAYDSRDESVYTIQKLADGKCWMLDNLALDISNSTIKSKLSAANTNASATTLNYLKNGGGSTSNKYPVSGATNWTADMSYSVPLVSVANKNTIPNNSNYGPGNHKVGGYYNFCAASAGSYCYGNGEMDYGNPSGNATEDICPAGWRMPTGGASGEYKALATAITGATSYNITDAAHVAAFRNALSLPFNGDWYGNSPSNQGTNGYFWASTMEDEESMHYLWMSQSYGVSPSASSMRTGGYAVRCLAK